MRGGLRGSIPATVAAIADAIHWAEQIGTIMIAALMVWRFVATFLNILRGLVPALTLFSSFIYAFACLSVAVFFYVFHKAQS
jgi:hypothetical protein